MKFIFFKSLFFLLVLNVSAQNWKQVQTVDEFGDLTGTSQTIWRSKGKFSNVATTDDNASILIYYLPQNSFVFSITEYNLNYPASFFCDYITIAFKTEGGTVYSSDVYNSKYGSTEFRIYAPSLKEIKRLQKKGQTHIYTLLSSYKGGLKTSIKCGNSKYRFTIKGVATPKGSAINKKKTKPKEGCPPKREDYKSFTDFLNARIACDESKK